MRISARWDLSRGMRLGGDQEEVVAVISVLWSYCVPCGGSRSYQHLKEMRRAMAPLSYARLKATTAGGWSSAITPGALPKWPDRVVFFHPYPICCDKCRPVPAMFSPTTLPIPNSTIE